MGHRRGHGVRGPSRPVRHASSVPSGELGAARRARQQPRVVSPDLWPSKVLRGPVSSARPVSSVPARRRSEGPPKGTPGATCYGQAPRRSSDALVGLVEQPLRRKAGGAPLRRPLIGGRLPRHGRARHGWEVIERHPEEAVELLRTSAANGRRCAESVPGRAHPRERRAAAGHVGRLHCPPLERVVRGGTARSPERQALSSSASKRHNEEEA